MPAEMEIRIQRLRQSRSYCLERSVEVKEEIARLHQEALELKAKIGLAPDETAEGRIRSRRRFLSRRIDELKAERSALNWELECAKEELTILTAGTTRDEHTHVAAESASSCQEGHEETESSEGRPALA